MVKILVVDDDPKLLKMVKRTLMYEGFQVSTAGDGNDALAKVQTQKPDLIELFLFKESGRLSAKKA